MSYVIVPAGPSDARDIARVHVQSWRETYPGLLPASFLAAMNEEVHARRWRTVLKAPGPDEAVLLAEGREGVVGYCSAGPSRFRRPGEAEIATLYVLRRAQGEGLGRRLVRDAARTLLAHDAHSLVISVLEDNLEARAFYEHLGGRAGLRGRLPLAGHSHAGLNAQVARGRGRLLVFAQREQAAARGKGTPWPRRSPA